MSDRPALILHGHFYQPPRENPWTGIVDEEPSAAPFHDWNDRITHECYRRNAFARIFDESGRVERIVNNYGAMSFNFGPTLLGWLDRHRPATYARILAADRESAGARGHGNALAQGYNHAILPLCNDRDLRTQIRWGAADFRFRFGREPEAMWLPETACDERTLDALIEQGMRFVVLAPGQAAAVRPVGGQTWTDVRGGAVDPRCVYRYLHPDGSGRQLAVFFYDGAVSRAIAFEKVLTSAKWLLDRFVRALDGPGAFVHAATDGESYGHHFAQGDLCLAYALHVAAEKRGFRVTNYAELLDHQAPTHDVRLHLGDDGAGSSWSCAHGVGRWMRDCGCHTGGRPGWSQRWRGPLRQALDVLRDEAAAHYEAQMGDLCEAPWAVRDAYIELLVDPSADRGRFFEQHAGRRLDIAQQRRALALCEMQRSSQLMYTSCGWFFSDLSGIETLQVLRYAGLLVDQLEALGAPSPRARLLEALAEAQSNLPEKGNGADLYRDEVEPTRVSDRSFAAHLSMCGLAGTIPASGTLAGRRYALSEVRTEQHAHVTLATSRIEIEQMATGAQRAFTAAALHLGGGELYAVLQPEGDVAAFAQISERLWVAFEAGSLLTLIRVAEELLGPQDYGLEHVLPSERAALSRSIFARLRSRYADQLERLYEENRRALAVFGQRRIRLPVELRAAAEVTLGRRLEEALGRLAQRPFDAESYADAAAIVESAERYGCELRREIAQEHFVARLEQALAGLVSEPAADAVEAAVADTLAILALAERMRLQLDVGPAQEHLFDVAPRLGSFPELLALLEALRMSPVCLTPRA